MEFDVLIEIPRGSRNKYEVDHATGRIRLDRTLFTATQYPADYGYVPDTLADDGDPLDVLVLLDEPVPAGCKIPARLIGVIEAEQTEDGETEQNDRLIAVAEDSQEHRDIRSLKDLNERLVQEIEHFFVSYNEERGRAFRVLGRYGPARAARLVRAAERRFQKKSAS